MEWEGVSITFPPELKDIDLEMGIDEAGRGPVLGPMVYCGCFAQVGYEWPDAVDDSKKLTADARESELDELKSLPVGFAVRVISAEEVSAKQLATSPINLNQQSFKAALAIINTVINSGLRIKSLYVDTVGPQETYQKWLQDHFPSIKVCVSKKADSLYKCVGAASICAKVTRDKVLHDFMFVEPNLNCTKNWGSGYPSDPTTKQWLQENFNQVFGYPSIVRFSWRPIEDIFVERKCEADFESIGSSDADCPYFQIRHMKNFCSSNNKQ